MTRVTGKMDRQSGGLMRRFVVGVWLAIDLLLIQAPGSVAADAGLDLHLVTGPDFKPFTDPGLPGGGMHVDIVKAAFAKVGRGVTVSFEPWARGYSDAQQLRFDGTFPYARTDERARDFLYSDLLYANISRPYVLAGASWKAIDLKDLAGKIMCNPVGYVVQMPIQDMVASGAIRVERPTSMPQCFKMLKAGRVDFVDCVDTQAKAAALEIFGASDAVKPLAAVLGAGGEFFIISRQHPDHERILADFNRGLAMLRASGEYDAIVKRHLAAFFGTVAN
jgi:polar amino acid transport system substrate-binding protein